MIAVGIFFCVAPTVVFGQTFVGITPLPDTTQTIAADVSGDGSTVVGRSGDPGSVPPRRSWSWTQSAGTVGLGVVPGYEFLDEARGVSDDGRVVTGIAGSTTTLNAFLWSAGAASPSAIAGLGRSNAISGNGLVVVGSNDGPGGWTDARRWSAVGGVQGFGTLSGTPHGVYRMITANGVSAEGSVIVGTARVLVSLGPPQPIEISTPFIWDAVNGARTITLPNGLLPEAVASDVTPNGHVMIGTAYNANLIFRWSASTGFQTIVPAVPLSLGLGEPRTAANGYAIVAGRNYWSLATGPITVEQALTNAGCDFAGWTITGTAGISDDGLTIAGNGINPQGQVQGWVATIPSPGTLAAAVGVVGVMAWRRRRQAGLV